MFIFLLMLRIYFSKPAEERIGYLTMSCMSHSDTQVVERSTLWGEKSMVLGIPLFGVKDNSAMWPSRAEQLGRTRSDARR